MPADEVARRVRDEAFAAQATTGRPLYTGISYLLVSMECLAGSAYTRMVCKAGLAGAARPAMGRVDARFADWRIGVASHWAQLWVDRNFALDYTLKSLEKVLDGAVHHAVREARVVLKDAAYTVLGEMIRAVEAQPPGGGPCAEQALSDRVGGLLDTQADLLRGRLASAVGEAGARLRAEHAAMLRREHERWASATGWQLINAADPCGT
jgi:hypothetical protein